MAIESTGIPELDFVTGGLPAHGLTIFIGEPGTGKTVLLLQMAMNHARQSKDVVFFSAFSESHEKLMMHLSGFSFFDSALIGSHITMLSLKATSQTDVTETFEVVLQAIRGKKEPLLIIDGFRGLYQRLGPIAAQDVLSGLATQLPFLGARCVIASEVLPSDAEVFFELSAADALISLTHTREGAQPVRTLEVIKVRGHAFRAGVHGLSITSDGISVYPRLASALPNTTAALSRHRCCFDLPAFDAMLGGGLPACSTTVLLGSHGTGRTTLSLHFLIAGARAGENGLLVTLGETAVDLLQKSVDLGIELQAHVEDGTVRLLEVPPVEIDPYHLAWQIRQEVEHHAIKRLVIDSITSLEDAASVQSTQRDYLAALALYLRRVGITTLMTKDESQDRPQVLSSVRMPTANNWIRLQRVAYHGRFYRLCAVTTMQRSNHDTAIHEFVIGVNGIHMVDQEKTQSEVVTAIEREHGYRSW